MGRALTSGKGPFDYDPDPRGAHRAGSRRVYSIVSNRRTRWITRPATATEILEQMVAISDEVICG